MTGMGIWRVRGNDRNTERNMWGFLEAWVILSARHASGPLRGFKSDLRWPWRWWWRWRWRWWWSWCWWRSEVGKKRVPACPRVGYPFMKPHIWRARPLQLGPKGDSFLSDPGEFWFCLRWELLFHITFPICSHKFPSCVWGFFSFGAPRLKKSKFNFYHPTKQPESWSFSTPIWSSQDFVFPDLFHMF